MSVLLKFDPAEPRDWRGRWTRTPESEWRRAGIPERGIPWGVSLRAEQVSGLSDHALDLLDAEVMGGPDQSVVNAERARRALLARLSPSHSLA